MAIGGRGRAGTRAIRRRANGNLGWLLGGSALAALAAAAPALGQEDAVAPAAAQALPFDIPAQPLAGAVTAFGRQSGLQVAVDSAILEGFRSQPVAGTLAPQEALARLLSGTGIQWRFPDAHTVVLERAGGSVVLDPLTVEGAATTTRFSDAPPETGGFVAEYQTTATKTPLTIQETPQAIGVATRESMDARQVRDIAGALELTAGAYAGPRSGIAPFAGYSRDGGERFVMRGQTLQGVRDVRIDGFAVNSIFHSFDPVAFERVEAVKGPSSMLYGQGSLGGFINLVRKRPEVDPTGSVALQAGSWETYRGEFDITGALDDEQNVAVRLSSAYEDAGSFVDGVQNQRAVLAPAVEARLGEDTRALVQGLYQTDGFIPTAGFPLRRVGNDLIVPDISRSLFVGVPSSEESEKLVAGGTARLDHEIADHWVASLLLQASHQTHRNIFDSYAYAPGGLYGAGDVGLYSSFWDAEDDLWAGELRLDGSVEAFGRRHLVLGGLEMNHQVSDFAYGYTALGTANIYQGNFSDAGIVPGGNNVTAASTTATVENKAIYGQVVFGLTERTRLLVGGRYDIADQESRDQLAAAVTGTKSDEAFTMRLGLSHDFTANVTVYGSYAQSFSPVTAVSRTGEILDPETGEGFELGLKTLWLGERLGATLALFRQELDNRPINDPGNGPGQFFSISGGLQRTDGIELEVSGSPYPGLEVGGAAALLDSEFIDPLDPNFGLRPEGALDRQFSLYASYELQQGSLEGFGVGATLVSVSDRVMLQGGENLFVQGYERLDLQATYRGIPGFDLALQIRNVLDARYVERVSNVPGFENHFGSPRALLVRAEVDF